MKIPETIEQFVELISTMEHRERFCFELPNPGDNYCLEVYATHINRTKLGDDPINISFQTVDALGKFDKKIHKKQSVLRKFIKTTCPLTLGCFEIAGGKVSPQPENQ